MKKLAFLFVLILTTSFFPQQKYYTFSELKGMEDYNGNTHLFYRLYFYQHRNAPMDDYEENSIYHFDIKNNSDSLFLFDGGTLFNGYMSITDYEFWDNNPHKYIYNAVGVTVDPNAFILRFDSGQQLLDVFGGYDGNLEISKQNDSLIYSSIRATLYQSTDGGWTWDTVTTTQVNLIAISPNNEQTIFGTTDLGELNKSIDGGKTFSIVDTSKSNYSSDNKILFDKDSNYVYRVFYNNNSYKLSVSNNQGNAFSWTNRFSSIGELYVSVDYSQAGTIYLADKKNIYFSNNFGESFSVYKNLDRNIIGIYKKPNSNILYAATKYDLYEITPDTIKTIKHLLINPEILNLYPLEIGNSWVYIYNVEMYHSNYTVSVIGDTIIKEKHYYKLINTISGSQTYSYERIDTSNGIVYRLQSNSEIPYYDFTAVSVGDTVYFNRGNEYEYGWFLENLTSYNKFGLNSQEYQYSMLLTGSGYQLYNFVKGLGLIKDEGGELLTSSSILKGAVINGVVYGDTTVVGVEDEPKNIPLKFSLSQNYPNPFNPTTKIKYNIPFVETRHASSVQLKIYDILGNGIATLVNKEQSPGEYEIVFDAGKYHLSSGIYFYRLKAGSFAQTKKLVLLK